MLRASSNYPDVATTTWEAVPGDPLDSLRHPWSTEQAQQHGPEPSTLFAFADDRGRYAGAHAELGKE
jgi:hypothetical protein